MEAMALIQTPKWFDAFPLVVLESFASGTPVIGLGAGGVPEQIKHGVNGFLCHNISEIADAMANINKIDPCTCREYAETHFSAKRMAHDYIALYQQVIEGKAW
jgi:glycosyltransferase involved in cell wall biosynthesis